MRHILALLLVALVCSGCARKIGGPSTYLVEEQTGSVVDLYGELVPATRHNDKDVTECRNLLNAAPTIINSDATLTRCMAVALGAFYSDRLDIQLRRNRIQNSLRRASDAQCEDYLRRLNSYQSGSNLALGLAATGLAGAGSIITNGTTARLFAGLAGISSGSRAEVNADLFYEKTVPILAKAIQDRRKLARADMDSVATNSIESYTVEAAIADVARYHGECNLVSGLAAVGAAVDFARDPGIEALNRVLVKVNAGRLIQDRRITDTNFLGRDGSISGAVAGAYGIAPATGTNFGSDPTRAAAVALANVSALFSQLEVQIGGLAAKPVNGPAAVKAVNEYRDARVGQYTACQINASPLLAAVAIADGGLSVVRSDDPAGLAAAQLAKAKAASRADAYSRQIDAAAAFDAALGGALLADLRDLLAKDAPKDAIDTRLTRVPSTFVKPTPDKTCPAS